MYFIRSKDDLSPTNRYFVIHENHMRAVKHDDVRSRAVRCVMLHTTEHAVGDSPSHGNYPLYK